MRFDERIVAKLRVEEGVRSRVYKCSLGFDTVGVGFNMERPDARVRFKAIGADYEAVRSGKAALSGEQIDALLMREIKVCLDDLRTLIAGFDDMPEDVRVVLVDMRFQLGPGGLRGFRNTLKAFRERRWADAAGGMLKSLAAKQTPKRWERNAKLIEGLA